jgi:hypothetical protein
MDKSGIFFVALLLVLVAIVLSLALFHSPQQSPALPSGEGSLLPPATTQGQWGADGCEEAVRACAIGIDGLFQNAIKPHHRWMGVRVV